MKDLPNILIGCPVYKRANVLPLWFKCIEKQEYPLDHVGFIFELGPDDDETHDILWQFHMDHPELIVFDGQIDDIRVHKNHEEGKRRWGAERYSAMVHFRNSLLERATALQEQFDFYFSLDSDLLLESPQTLRQFVEDCENPDVDVVSGLSYMTPRDIGYPSVMYWTNKPGGPARHGRNAVKFDGLFQADVVLASVFMKRHVYTQVRYWFHKQGEDLGFAGDLAQHGFKAWCDGRVYLPHMMHQFVIDSYLERGYDTRSPHHQLTNV